MPCRELLVVHETEKIRDLIRRFLKAEMADLVFDEAGSMAEAMDLLTENKYDLVLCGRELEAGLDSANLSKRMRSTPNNAYTPFLILTHRDESQDFDELIRQGLGHFMHIPTSARELANEINNVCNPSAWRKSKRVHVPGTIATVCNGGHEIFAQVVNLSDSGALCDLDYSEKFGELSGDSTIALEFSEHYGAAMLPEIPCKLLRMNVLRWGENNVPSRVRAAYVFDDVDEGCLGMLLGIIAQVEDEEDQEVADIMGGE